jgi:hypothetical protein
LDNVQTHADLIAGLPEYTLDMLYKDIIKLVEIGVDELQIESLKVLPGTKMRKEAKNLELKYSPLPPYEVLRTPAMSPDELRTAMQLSRTIDLYYNAEPWQKVIRELICSDEDFLLTFTKHLKEMMVLDSPISMERRGVILYEYCRSHYPERLCDVSIAWIQGGFSLKKEPAGNIIKIKSLDAFLEEHTLGMTTQYGEASPSHRFYLYSSDNRHILFGYDSSDHQPTPVFMADLRCKKYD